MSAAPRPGTARRRRHPRRRGYGDGDVHPPLAAACLPRITGPGPATALFAADRMAFDLAGSTPAPGLPTLTIAELGMLREVRLTGCAVTMAITPAGGDFTALREISADISRRLEQAGFAPVSVRTQAAPAWTADWITSEGLRKLAVAGLAR